MDPLRVSAWFDQGLAYLHWKNDLGSATIVHVIVMGSVVEENPWACKAFLGEYTMEECHAELVALDAPHALIVHVRGSFVPVFMYADGHPHTVAEFYHLSTLFQYRLLVPSLLLGHRVLLRKDCAWYRAMTTWTLCARRLGLCRDVRTLISKFAWANKLQLLQ